MQNLGENSLNLLALWRIAEMTTPSEVNGASECEECIACENSNQAVGCCPLRYSRSRGICIAAKIEIERDLIKFGGGHPRRGRCELLVQHRRAFSNGLWNETKSRANNHERRCGCSIFQQGGNHVARLVHRVRCRILDCSQ